MAGILDTVDQRTQLVGENRELANWVWMTANKPR